MSALWRPKKRKSANVLDSVEQVPHGTSMTTRRANDLRKQINALAEEYRAAEPTETRAELRNRKARIIELERQLTEG